MPKGKYITSGYLNYLHNVFYKYYMSNKIVQEKIIAKKIKRIRNCTKIKKHSVNIICQIKLHSIQTAN